MLASMKSKVKAKLFLQLSFLFIQQVDCLSSYYFYHFSIFLEFSFCPNFSFQLFKQAIGLRSKQRRAQVKREGREFTTLFGSVFENYFMIFHRIA